jgi:hypothetical protein
MDYWGLAFADRNLAFTGAASDAKGKDCRTDENQNLFHDDATRVYPLELSTCTIHRDAQLVRKSHTPHICALPDDADSLNYWRLRARTQVTNKSRTNLPQNSPTYQPQQWARCGKSKPARLSAHLYSSQLPTRGKSLGYSFPILVSIFLSASWQAFSVA